MDGMRNDSSPRSESSVITRIEAAEVLALPCTRCAHRAPDDDRGLAISRPISRRTRFRCTRRRG